MLAGNLLTYVGMLGCNDLGRYAKFFFGSWSEHSMWFKAQHVKKFPGFDHAMQISQSNFAEPADLDCLGLRIVFSEWL